MMNAVEIAERARAAGRAGSTWQEWTFHDEAAQDFVCENDEHSEAIALWHAAFDAGAAEHRIASGWVVRWTTAPSDYDGFGTVGEAAGDWHGKPLRKVLIHPHHVGWHEARYSSGLGGCWSTDPIAETAALEERSARWRADNERRAAARAAGLQWLVELSDPDIEAVDFDTAEAHGLQSGDVREERDRRAAARSEAARAELWDRCIAAVPAGSTLIDAGTPGFKGIYGWVKGAPENVHYEVRLTNDWAKKAEDALVVSSSGATVGALDVVADWLASGRLRVAKPGEVPPAPVTKRLGAERWREIQRVEIGDRVLWVGRPLFTYELLVLDDRGRKARRKADVDAAVAAFYA